MLFDGPVVDRGLALGQVADEEVPDSPTSDRVAVDELLHAQLAVAAQRSPGRHVGPKDAHLPKHLEKGGTRADIGPKPVLGV